MNTVCFILIIMVALYLPNTVNASDFEASYCIKEGYLETTDMHPPLRLTTMVKSKVDKVRLQMPVSCKKGKLLIPKSQAQAIEYLDIMLPIDFKTGLLYSENSTSIYLTSPYGGSVVNDLHNYLYKPWKLHKSRNICYPKGGQTEDSEECFNILLDKLVQQYKSSVKYE
ncbi:MAG: hypothetical protein DWP95_05675 [Proteobacteria bacterium]|nr:MAG: hypothetical protein DWP95_05675 [Pseudomonadota bacterium]